jgi:PAS domain S-box-containing protein
MQLSRYDLETLREDGELILYRGKDKDGTSRVLVLSPGGQRASPESLKRLENEYSLKEELDPTWATRPLAITAHRDRMVLVLQDPGGVPLNQLLGSARDASAETNGGVQPLDIALALRLAISFSASIGALHQRGIIHKNIKPANVLVNSVTGQCWLTGFGIASQLPRERQPPAPPEFIAGTLPYMAPEQTGRMNRSIDSRSDLYALGVTLYEMLTGTLPFSAEDPMEWVHCHIAREPIPPNTRSKTVPGPVSAIIMKLLAKTAEERYQTAAGLESDLRRCLDEWEHGSDSARRGQEGAVSSRATSDRSAGTSSHQIQEFALGEHDTPDRLQIPEKLYGRAHQIDTLLASFDRVAAKGRPELVLVSGYSGIGKSSVVNELHKVLVPPRGLFASGKFDQYKRNIPYSTLAQAFQSLVRPLFAKSEAELRNWRDVLREAVGPNGRLIVDLVPELALILGEQPPIPELPPQDAQRRFQLVLRRFIGVFARSEHPLALFLDDLQWLDAATLDFLQDLLAQPDVHHLMLIGAYRDNEVDLAHPLWRKLEAIRQTGARVQEIVLAPLTSEDLGQLLVDTLHSEPERVTPLAHLVHEKTAGNPFFAIQFISALAEEALLTFDHGVGRWSWDVGRIHGKGYTDNVVDLMVGKLNRLPVETQKALQEFACLGNCAAISTLSIVHGTSEEKVTSDLWEAERLEFIVRSEGVYRFLHDRVQEAAYSQIRAELRPTSHLRIGRLLAAHTSPENREEAIFEIVNQLNRGAILITAKEDRKQLAELNLIAGKRAKASTAYASALTYLVAGAALLANDSWERRHELTFTLELNRAECEFLTSALAEADRRLVELSNRAETIVERAAVACLQTDVYTTLGQTDRAVAVCLDYLRYAGIHWTPHPTEEETRREYEYIWKILGNRTIEALIDLPLMDDPGSLATMDVLTKLLPPAAFTDASFACMTICRAVSLSLERGNCDASCFAYSNFSRMTRPRFGDYEAGYRLGELGFELVERGGLKRFEASTYLCFGLFVLPWTKHVRVCRDLLQRAFEIANRNGDLMWASYTSCELNSCRLFAGDPLPELQREAERGFTIAEKAGFALCMDGTTTVLALSRTLRGLTPKFGSFDDIQLNELQFEHHISSKPHLAIAACRHWVRKLQARYLAGDYMAALDALSRAQQLLWTSTSFFEEAEYFFYGALLRGALYDAVAAVGDGRMSLPSVEPAQHVEALASHYRQLRIWAEHCPENFENRAALVGAEIARIEGREREAARLYEQAIRSAHTNGFVHNEALANELAARFYRAIGFEKIADGYLRDARYWYLRWGAAGKVRQLDELYPHLVEKAPSLGPTSTIGAPIDELDLTTVVKALQALSSEIVLEKLIDTLMRMVIEQAAAQRGVLILARDEDKLIEAEATTSGDTIVVRLQEAPVAEDAVPESIIRYVARTHESVILDDASARHPFSADSYVRQQHARSILCLPLINQAKLIGLLYLENNLSPNVFTPMRSAALKLLASQAAISFENTRLYRDLQEREGKIRRLVDANIIGICIWNLQGEIIEANEAFLRMLKYSREDLVSGYMRWTDLTPAEWRDRDEQAVAELKTAGTAQPYQKEFFRKDGSRVPVMIGGAIFEGSTDEGVAFVLDLSEQKRAEKERKRAEDALQKAQAELAHVSRVTTLGELVASISHEINQPLAAVVNNASACVRWLTAQNLEEARQSASVVIAEGHRAGEIIGRIRSLAKKAPPQMDWLNLNETIGEVVAMARSEMERNRISLQTQLATDLPLILGDRIQLQQVVLNLLINAIEAMSGMREGPRELWVSSEKVAEIHGTSEKDRVADRALAEVQFTQVLLTVRDSGLGLDPKVLDRLFDAFYTTKPHGLGMGLAISRSIIEAHGGRLWANANAPRGAVFQFMLPI